MERESKESAESLKKFKRDWKKRMDDYEEETRERDRKEAKAKAKFKKENPDRKWDKDGDLILNKEEKEIQKLWEEFYESVSEAFNGKPSEEDWRCELCNIVASPFRMDYRRLIDRESGEKESVHVCDNCIKKIRKDKVRKFTYGMYEKKVK